MQRSSEVKVRMPSFSPSYYENSSCLVLNPNVNCLVFYSVLKLYTIIFTSPQTTTGQLRYFLSGLLSQYFLPIDFLSTYNGLLRLKQYDTSQLHISCVQASSKSLQRDYCQIQNKGIKWEVESYKEQMVLTGGEVIWLVVRRECKDWENRGRLRWERIDYILCLVLLVKLKDSQCCWTSSIQTLKNSLTMTLTKCSASLLLTQNTTTLPLFNLRNCSNLTKTLTAYVSENGTPLHLNFVSICFAFSFVNIAAFVKLNIWQYLPWQDYIWLRRAVVLVIDQRLTMPMRGKRYQALFLVMALLVKYINKHRGCNLINCFDIIVCKISGGLTESNNIHKQKQQPQIVHAGTLYINSFQLSLLRICNVEHIYFVR